jgi:[acyl-carrier-protein] S-malonyltransferase
VATGAALMREIRQEIDEVDPSGGDLRADRLDHVLDQPPHRGTRTGDTALLFPGQGSQVEGMRDSVAEARPDLLELAIAEVGEDPFERVADSTRFAQPAIYCASIAALRSVDLERVGWMAGHSLGEFAALVAAGSLRAEDALRLVVLRGRLMDEAAGGAGAMLALRGADVWEMATEIALETGTYPANHNAPTQVVLAGREGAIAEAHRIARTRGLRAMVLPVRGAFHTLLMESTREPFERALAHVDVRQPRVPVISGTTAAPFDDVRAGLRDALTSPVRWLSVLETIHGFGARRFLEAGPGSVLTGLVRKTLDCVEAGTVEELTRA